MTGNRRWLLPDGHPTAGAPCPEPEGPSSAGVGRPHVRSPAQAGRAGDRDTGTGPRGTESETGLCQPALPGPAPLALWGAQARPWGAGAFVCATAAARACAHGTQPIPGPRGTASGTGTSPRPGEWWDADVLPRQEEAAASGSASAGRRAPALPKPGRGEGAAAAARNGWAKAGPAIRRGSVELLPRPGTVAGRGGGSSPDQHPWRSVSGRQGEPRLLPSSAAVRGAAERPSRGSGPAAGPTYL